MLTRNYAGNQPFDAIAFEEQRYQVFQQTEIQLKESRKILENAKGRAYGGTDLAKEGRRDGLSGQTPTMPHFKVYWDAWCEAYREYLIGHPDF